MYMSISYILKPSLHEHEFPAESDQELGFGFHTVQLAWLEILLPSARSKEINSSLRERVIFFNLPYFLNLELWSHLE